MERKKIAPNVEDGEVMWQKIGGGSFRLNGRMIKPGQKFAAKESDIPVSFRDVVIKVGEAAQPKPAPEILGIVPVYEVKVRGKGGLWYDVVDQNGKVLNEKALKKDIAEKLVKDLAR